MHFESPEETRQRKAREAAMSEFVARRRAEHLADPEKTNRVLQAAAAAKKKEEVPTVGDPPEPLSSYEEEFVRRAELKRLLTVDELVLSDTEREKLLLIRQTAEHGFLRGPDFLVNEGKIGACAAERAFRRNNFGFGSWYSTLSRSQQIGFWFGLIAVQIFLRFAL